MYISGNFLDKFLAETDSECMAMFLSILLKIVPSINLGYGLRVQLEAISKVFLEFMFHTFHK